MGRAWAAVESGDSATGLAALQRLWDEGHRHYEVAWIAAYGALGTGNPAAAFTWLERAVERGMDVPDDLLRDRPLEPLRSMPGFDALVARARKNALDARVAGNVGAGLEKTTPAQAGLSEPALAELLKAAEDSGSSALVLLRHGKLVGEWYFGGETRRIESMSATKAVVALAIGLLIDDGKIPSADTPVSAFFPEWKEGRRGKVTLRHLLSHTSGLAANRTAMDIYQSKDYVRYALEADLVEEPGTRFFYNNKATNLLAGVVERASGEKLDVYLKRRLFAPLGIRDVAWQKDPSGNPAQPQNATSGLLWWLVYERTFRVVGREAVEEARRNGMPEESLARLADLVDRPIPSADFLRTLNERLGGMEGVVAFMQKSARVQLRTQVEGPPRGYSASGQAGQRLMVLPEQGLVVVRMAVPKGRVPEDVIEFPRLDELVLKLVPLRPGALSHRQPW